MTDRPDKRAVLYQIHAWCPRCDKLAEAIAPLIPNPRIPCRWCLRDDVVSEMKIVSASQLESNRELS